MTNFKDAKTIILFLVIAFSLPLLCVLIMKYNTNAQNSIWNFILYGVEAASPSIAAIAAVGVMSGSKGIKAFLHNCFSPKIKAAAILVPVLIALGIMLAAKVITCLWMNTSFQINPLSFKKLIIIAWAFFAEEIGWRGFLQKKLTKTIPAFIVPFILGLIWSGWHYHFFIMGSMDVPIVWFVVGCIAESYVYLFLLKLSLGNIVVAMMYHLSGNLFLNLFCINPDMNAGSEVPYIVSVLLTMIFGTGLTILIKKKSSWHFRDF